MYFAFTTAKSEGATLTSKWESVKGKGGDAALRGKLVREIRNVIEAKLASSTRRNSTIKRLPNTFFGACDEELSDVACRVE